MGTAFYVDFCKRRGCVCGGDVCYGVGNRLAGKRLHRTNRATYYPERMDLGARHWCVAKWKRGNASRSVGEGKAERLRAYGDLRAVAIESSAFDASFDGHWLGYPVCDHVIH